MTNYTRRFSICLPKQNNKNHVHNLFIEKLSLVAIILQPE